MGHRWKRLKRVSVTNTGDQYTAPPAVTVDPPAAPKQEAKATVNIDSSGAVTGTNLDSGGNFYATLPTVTLSAPDSGGTQAEAVASLTNGEVSLITITNPGSGYSSPPTLTIPKSTDDKSLFAASVSLDFDSATGTVTKVNVLDSGNFYDSSNPPNVKIDAPFSAASFERGEDVTIAANSTGAIVTGEVAEFKDSSVQTLSLIHVANSTGDFTEPGTGLTITGSTSGASRQISKVTNPDTNANQADEFDTTAQDFLDFSETNPFGEPEAATLVQEAAAAATAAAAPATNMVIRGTVSDPPFVRAKKSYKIVANNISYGFEADSNNGNYIEGIRGLNVPGLEFGFSLSDTFSVVTQITYTPQTTGDTLTLAGDGFIHLGMIEGNYDLNTGNATAPTISSLQPGDSAAVRPGDSDFREFMKAADYQAEVARSSTSMIWDSAAGELGTGNIVFTANHVVNPTGTYINPNDVVFGDNGKRVFYGDQHYTDSTARVISRTLSTAYDISSIHGDITIGNFSTDFARVWAYPDSDTFPYKGSRVTAIAFNPEGTKLYINENSEDVIAQYSLADSWDISTASLDKAITSTNRHSSGAIIMPNYSYNLNFPGGNAYTMEWFDSGRKMAIGRLNYTGTTSVANFTIPYDIGSFTTSTDYNNGLPLTPAGGFGNQPLIPRFEYKLAFQSASRFNKDGTRRYYVHTSFEDSDYDSSSSGAGNGLNGWRQSLVRTDLSVPYDLSTMNFHSQIEITNRDSGAPNQFKSNGFAIHPDGTQFYVITNNTQNLPDSTTTKWKGTGLQHIIQYQTYADSNVSTPSTVSGGEGVYGSSITHGQWRNVASSTTNNPQIYIRQAVVGGNSQTTAAVNLRNALNNLQVGDTITVASPAKVFTISGGISTYLDTNTDYRVWLFDVDAQGLTNSTYFYEFTIPTTTSAPSNLITRPNMATKPFTAADSDDQWAVPYLRTDLTAYKALIDSASPHYRPPYVSQSSSNYSIDNLGNLNDSGNYTLYGRDNYHTPINGNWASNVNGERVWMEFAQSGRKLFVADRYHQGYNVYDLSTPYEIETAVEDSSKAIATGTEFWAPFTAAGYNYGLVNNADGNFKFNGEGDEVTILYPIMGNTPAALRTFNLSTPFDMSTIVSGSLVDTPFTSGWDANTIGATVTDVMDSNRIYPTTSNFAGNWAMTDGQFSWLDSGKKLGLTGGQNNGNILIYDVPTPYDHSSITWYGTGHNLYSAINLYDVRNAISARTGYTSGFQNRDFSFSDDGKVLYQQNTNAIFEYKLDSAYNLGSIDSADVNILYAPYDTLAGGSRLSNNEYKSIRVTPNGRLHVGFNGYYDSSDTLTSTAGIMYFDLKTDRGVPPGYNESDGSFLRSTATNLIATVATGNLYTDTGITGGSGNVYYMSIDEGVLDAHESDGTFFVDSNSTVGIVLDDLYGGGYGNAFTLTADPPPGYWNGSETDWNGNGQSLSALLPNNPTTGTSIDLSTNLLSPNEWYPGAPSGPFKFSPDGKYFVATPYQSPVIRIFTLNTAFDLTSGSSAITSYTRTGAQAPYDMHISEDGTKLYEGRYDAINEYTLSTPWDASTMSLTHTLDTTSGSGQMGQMGSTTINGISGVHLSSDGTKLITTSQNHSRIFIHNLNTPWSLSSIDTGSSKQWITTDASLWIRGIVVSADGKTFVYQETNKATGVVEKISWMSFTTPFVFATTSVGGQIITTDDDGMGFDIAANGSGIFYGSLSDDKIWKFS